MSEVLDAVPSVKGTALIVARVDERATWACLVSRVDASVADELASRKKKSADKRKTG
jgi:hypothetical protein